MTKRRVVNLPASTRDRLLALARSVIARSAHGFATLSGRCRLVETPSWAYNVATQSTHPRRYKEKLV